MNGHKSKGPAVLGAALCIFLMTAETADARRGGGGFGSRGARTYAAPPPTKTAPQAAAPIQRSMTAPAPAPKAAAAAPAAAPRAAQPRPGGFLGRFGGGILGGLLLGGLIGAMMGNGFGAGMAGFMAVLFQLALVAGVVFLLMKLFRRRAQPAVAGAAGWPNQAAHREAAAPQDLGGARAPAYTPATPAYIPVTPEPEATVEIGVTGQDRDTFERLLIEVQDALGREDYGALRERTTPEIMGFLAEDMAQNATQGRRNEISGTTLLEADVAEAWREGDRDYATAAMRYEAIDVVRDRTSGAILEGDAERPLQTTELWTFVRQDGGPWKLSAIQTA